VDTINTYNVVTFGCKVNTYDSGLIQKNMNGAGWTESQVTPHIIILNTCAVTASATKEAVKDIRRIKLKNPNCQLVVTGCSAQVDTDKFSELESVDLIVANSHKDQLSELIRLKINGQLKEKVIKSNIFKVDELGEGGGQESLHTRSFLKIQDGCNSFCSFCIIPFARGKSRSISFDSITEKVNELHDRGVLEVVISGIHIGDYFDSSRPGGKNNLDHLMGHLLKNTKMHRFRISSLEPIELSDPLLELYKDTRLCKHFHMSVQSVNSKVLRDMKRKYDSNAVLSCLEKINKHLDNPFVGMDVIVGFPGESDSDFLDTYNKLKNSAWTKLHVFPYSERIGTYATRLGPQLKNEVKKWRSKELRTLSNDRLESEARRQIGKTHQVLMLNSSAHKKYENYQQGLSRNYWPIQLPFIGGKDGREFSARVTKVEMRYNRPQLFGEWV